MFAGSSLHYLRSNVQTAESVFEAFRSLSCQFEELGFSVGRAVERLE